MKAKITASMVVALVACAAAWLPARAAPAATETRVVAFAGTKAGSAQGKPALILCVTPRYGGKPLEITVPNPTLVEAIKGVREGDLLKVTYEKKPGRLVLSAVEKHTARPGETDPEACEFVKKTEKVVGGQTHQAVVLRKVEKELTALVPNRTGADGAPVPDPTILGQIDKLAAGDFADVQTTQSEGNTYLKSIHPWQEPKSATFVRSATAKNAAGAMETTVTLKSGERTVEVCVPAAPGGAPDPAIMSRLRGLQANTPVLYKSVEADGREWLTDIRANRPSGGELTGELILTGTFVWTGKPSQVTDLKAVLTPTGPGEWKAVYTFTWGQPKTYVGVVKGNPLNGQVGGTGNGDNRTFEWTGTARNGVIPFEHCETTGNRRTPTGTGTMRLQR